MAGSSKIKALTSSDANTLAGFGHDYYIDANNFTNMPPSDLSGDTTPQLGGNLDLNSNNVTGTGNINVTGTITGTSFSGPLTGNVTGNADTATTLATARNVAGVSFDGSSDISLASSNLSDGSSLATLTDTQTLTNKTINLSNNTLSGTAAQFNTALSDGSFKVSGSYSTGEIIEELNAVCNKTDLHGRATIQNVTANQTIPESYVDATGSVVTSYTPLTGTKMIVFEYHFMMNWANAHAISHWNLYYQVSGGTWTEVTKARTTLSGYYPEDKHFMRWMFEVNAASDDSTLGIFNAATPQLGFKWQARDYGGSNQRGYLHRTTYFNGTGSATFSQPTITIRAVA